MRLTAYAFQCIFFMENLDGQKFSAIYSSRSMEQLRCRPSAPMRSYLRNLVLTEKEFGVKKTKPESKNEVQKLQKALQAKFPAAKINLDEPLRKTGAWVLDVLLPDYHLAIVWHSKRGFGLLAENSKSYGAGPDEVFENLEAAKSRAMELIKSKSYTVPPTSVRLKDIRESLGISQEEVGRRLGKKQGGISRQESRNDFLISTLSDYVSALGCKLVVKVVLPDATESELRL